MEADGVDTYAFPGREACLRERSARAARWAHDVKKIVAGGGMPISGCQACGMNTGNWCDGCEVAGRTFRAYGGQLLAGRPLCTKCEEEERCRAC